MSTTQASEGPPERGIALSIIIVTFEARDVVVDCLESICLNPPHEPYEVFVVDNGSTDGTSDIIRSRFPEVRLVRIPINGPYAVANNRALALARGRYLCLLNNDTIVLPEAFDRMLAFLHDHPEAGAIGCRLLLCAQAVAAPRLRHDDAARSRIYFGCRLHASARSRRQGWRT